MTNEERDAEIGMLKLAAARDAETIRILQAQVNQGVLAGDVRVPKTVRLAVPLEFAVPAEGGDVTMRAKLEVTLDFLGDDEIQEGVSTNPVVTIAAWGVTVGGLDGGSMNVNWRTVPATSSGRLGLPAGLLPGVQP